MLYKEKINYKLPGGAGYSAHQDAPAYPMIDAHVSAMIAIDDADETNGGLEVVSDCFDAVLPTDERGCIEPDRRRDARLATGGGAGREHAVVPQPHPAPQRAPTARSRPRRALYPTYNAASEGDRRAEYYADKQAAFARADPGDRALVSLIGDFEGRPA